MKKYLYPGLALLFMGAVAFAQVLTGTNSEWKDSRFQVGALTIGTTDISSPALQLSGRGYFEICGDIATVSSNTVYYGPSQAVVDSATTGMVTCNTNAAGDATEATADAPAIEATAFYPLGMVCYSTDMGATGSPMTLAFRNNAGANTPALSVSIADNVLSGASNVVSTAPVAAASPVAIAVTSAGDVGAGAFYCRISYAF